MKKTAIYPGTFDPITYGHIDVIQKSLKIVDKVIVGISNGNQKNYLFSIDERIEIVNKALFSDLRFNKSKIKVVSFNSLTEGDFFLLAPDLVVLLSVFFLFMNHIYVIIINFFAILILCQNVMYFLIGLSKHHQYF